MFDHLGIVVTDLSRSQALYTACLAPLGIGLLQDHSQADGTGWLVYGTAANAPFFVVAAGRPGYWQTGHEPGASPPHIAFSAASPEAVDRFHAEGLASGATDHGAPGPRHGSYAAYLLDLDGNNVEASFRTA